MLVVLCRYLDVGLAGQDYQVIECFAGQARIARLASSIGLRSCAHDVLYDDDPTANKKAMDVNGNAGYVPMT